ncbi:MAG: phosphodiesterase [Sphingomonas sp.]|nr:phosphodiesterase [Sphingomonas sp.]
MLIAQITDVHLGFEPDDPAEFNARRLNRVLRWLIDGPNRPDMLLVTGDLTDRGDADSYRRLANALSQCPFPIHCCLGNHDNRANYRVHFPDATFVDGFNQYVVALDGLRLVVLDTLEPGRHGGAFCETRAAWLSAQLAADSSTPTVIVMHHPPIEVGIAWMNTDPREPWVVRLVDALAGHDQVKALICGHLHRPVAAQWHGMTLAACAATAPQVTLDLRPIDPAEPDNRPLVIADSPAYALHRWSGGQLVTHFDTAAEHIMLAKFDKKLQPMIESLIAERPR